MKNRSKDNIQTDVQRLKPKKKKNEGKYSKRLIRQVDKDQHTCIWVLEVQDKVWGIITK